MANLDLVSTWASYGTLDGQNYSPTQWRTWWQELFDGNQGNGELDYMEFDDENPIYNLNLVALRYKDGSMSAIYGLPEQVFDQFRKAVSATRP
jgi:hypothetical protein